MTLILRGVLLKPMSHRESSSIPLGILENRRHKSIAPGKKLIAMLVQSVQKMVKVNPPLSGICLNLYVIWLLDSPAYTAVN